MEWKDLKDYWIAIILGAGGLLTAIIAGAKSLGWVKATNKENVELDGSKANIVKTITESSASLLTQMTVLLKRADIAEVEKQTSIDKLRSEAYALNEELILCKRNVVSLIDKIEGLQADINEEKAKNKELISIINKLKNNE